MNKNLMPELEKWSDLDLDKYIKLRLDEFHRDHNIKNINDAVSRLRREWNEGFISKREYELLKRGEMDYWRK